MVRLRRFVVVWIVLLTGFLIVLYLVRVGPDRLLVDTRNWWAGDLVDFTYANNVTGFSHFVVPNVVHFVRLGNASLSFVNAVCIRAAWIHQRPESLMIHCDECDAARKGPHWPLVSDIPGLSLKLLRRPRYIFGKTLSSVYHASDIARLRVLRQYGGIFLDGDSYLVKSLDSFRHYEMTLGWYPGQSLGTQVLVAHRNARFLKFWQDSYRYYRPDRWYWNAGQLPTEMILVPRPYLVHRVPFDFGVHNLAHLLYAVCTGQWRGYYAIHLLFRHREYLVPSDRFGKLDVHTVAHYNRTFGQMARLVLFGTTKLGASELKDVRWFLDHEPKYPRCT
ncbi:uncharacterized protein LOC8043598 [Ixodes scapularis]|uniref:uncharacterized protein LOC8043598 n=1 Tax=Ixodes scapularis TaxID=6945 RepID=UPI001A9DC49F|nr:uncharacterized protein LOC8043598 [Ixodes scapularis]